MAIRLNLYHEVLKAKALKRRDPLKLSIYVLVAIAAFCAVWYGVQLIAMSRLNGELASQRAEFEKVEPAAKTAAARQTELLAEAERSKLLEQRMEGRFYWAPVLAEIMEVVPRDVQITRLGGEVTGDGLRRCQITIDGLSAGADPRKVAEDLRTAIAEQFTPNFKDVSSTFKTLEDGTDLVMLEGKQMATATFAISVQLTTGEDKTAPTARRKK